METMRTFIKILLLILLFNIPKVAISQYIITDKDGYTNVREKPSSKSKIVGTIQKGKAIVSPMDICGFEGYPEYSTIHWDNPDWVPALLSEEPLVYGYVYRKNTSLTESYLKRLDVKSSTDSTIIFFGNEVEVAIYIVPFDTTAFNVTKDVFFWMVDGQYPKGVDAARSYWLDSANIFTIKEVIIKYSNKPAGNSFLESEINKVVHYCPFCIYATDIVDNAKVEYRYISASKGLDNEIYISLHGGDASSAFWVTWTFINGVYKWKSVGGAC